MPKIKKTDTVLEKVKTAEPVETAEAVTAIVESVTLTEETFNQRLAAVSTAVNSAQEELQALALSALVECSKAKNADRVNAMIKALPESMSRNNLRRWFESFGQVKYVKESKQLAYDKSKRANVWGASRKQWFKMIQEAEYKPFDMLTKLQMVYDQAMKKLAKKNPKDALRPEQVNQLGAFIAEMKQRRLVTEQNAEAEASEAAAMAA